MDWRWSDKRRSVPSHDAGDVHLSERSKSLNDIELFVWREADSAVIEWQHPKDPNPDDIPEDALWTIERSCSPFGPWQKVDQNITRDTRRYRDDDVPQARTNTRFVFYRVRWSSDEAGTSRIYGCSPQWEDTDVPGGVTWDFGGVPAHLAPGIIREMRNRFILLLRSHNHTPVIVYRPNWLAGFDHKVVNNVTGVYKGDWGESASTNGQPFVGGYAHPFESSVDRGPQQIAAQLTQGRVTDLKQVACEMPYWPPILQDDILRFHNGMLMQVALANPSQMHDHTISYTVQLSEVPRDHPVNKLPMPTGFRQASQFARRAASRATNLESYRRSQSLGSQRRASILPPTVAPTPGEEDR